MRQAVRYLLIAMFVLVAVAPEAMARILGVVVTPDFAPVVGAKVCAYRLESLEERAARLMSEHPEITATAAATTDANGRFAIDVKAPVVRILVQSPAGAAGQFDAERDDDLGMILLPAGTPRRMALSANGKAVANAIVVVGSFVTHSDGDGNYKLPSIWSGAVVIIHPDYSIVERPTGPEKLAFPGPIQLTQGVSVEGAVQNDNGDAAKGAVVWIDGWPLAKTGLDGRFTVRHAPERWSTAFVTDGTSSAVFPRTTGGRYSVRLHRGATLRGKIVDKRNGRPVAGAEVRLVGGPAIRTAIGDATGAFSFPAVPPGTYWLPAFHPRYRGTSESFVRVRGGDEVTRVVEVAAASAVSGTVVDEQHKPIEGALVWSGYSRSPPAGEGTSVALTAADGSFTLRNTGWLALTGISAASNGYVPSHLSNLTIAQGETRRGVIVTLPSGFEASIDVVDLEGSAINGASVELTRWTDDTGRQKDFLLCTETDRSHCFATVGKGRLTLQVLPGKYDIAVGGLDLVSKRLTGVDLLPRTMPLKIVMVRGAVVSGKVLFHDETPAAGVYVAVKGANGSGSNGDGSFEVRGIPPGAVTVMANTVNGPGEEKRITAPAAGIVLHVTRPGRVEGRVIDKLTHRPIVEFRAWTSGGGVPVGSSLSDIGPSPLQHSEEGVFALEAVRPGSVDVGASADGYTVGQRGGVRIEEGKTTAGIDIELTHGVKLSGRVVSVSNHTPVPNVNVAIGRGDNTSHDASTSAMTDDAGEFDLDGLAPGEKTLTFVTDGYLQTRKTIELSEMDAHIDVEMDRGREVRGHVVDESGTAVEAAWVSASSSSATRGSSGNTDATGLFKLESMTAGNYTVSAGRQGYVSAQLAGVEGATAENLTLVLKRGGIVTGHVSGVPPSDVGGAYVALRGADASTVGSALDASGNFTIRTVPDGTFMISAATSSEPIRHTALKSVTVANGTSSPVELQFMGGASLRGRITRTGKALERAAVTVCCIGMVSGFAQTGADGTYEIRDLVPGSYQVMVIADGSGTRPVSVTIDASGAVYDVDLTDATIRGRVVDANGQPISDAMITLSRGPGTRPFSSDADGRFLVEHVSEGRYRLSAQKNHYGSVAKDVSVETGMGVDVDLVLAPVDATLIRAVDSRDDTVLDVSILVSDSSQKLVQSFVPTRTDDGAMRLWLEPGEYGLVVSASGYVRENLKITVPAPLIQVRLRRAGSLSITYWGTANVRVEAVSDSGEHSAIFHLFTGRMRSIDGLVPGQYVLHVVDDSGKTIRTYPVQVVEGRVTPVIVE